MEKITRLFDLLEQYKGMYSWKNDAFYKKIDDKWVAYSSKDYLYFANMLSLGFLSMGIKKGDKVATILLNSPEWNFFDMALLQIGAIQVPVYPTISESNYKYIFNDAEVKYVIVSNEEVYENIAGVIKDVNIEGVFSIEDVNETRSWTEILTLGKEHPDPGVLESIKEGIQPEDVATIIYTSGTTGYPKGVMLSHENIIHNFLGAHTIPDYHPEQRVLSFLPLCHIFERILNYLFQYNGLSIYYIDKIEEVGPAMREIKPHTFGAVPRVIEKTFDKILKAGRNLKGIKRQLFFWALNLGYRYEMNGANGWWYEFQLKIANVLIFKKWREAMGGNIYIIISGGAPLQSRLARVFWAAGITILEGYGLTETSPVIAVSSFAADGFKFGTVGLALPGVEIKIAGDGEILTRSPSVMLGYYNKPEETKAVIDDEGWLHTGDIGHLEEGRYLKITDRKKEIFKTSGGKYIAPQMVENKMKESPFIDSLMVVGENRHFCTALIAPNFEHIESWCGVKGIAYNGREESIQNEVIFNRIKREVDTLSAELDKVEQIKKFILLTDEWAVETGELSPTLKLRRKFLHQKYDTLIDEIYV